MLFNKKDMGPNLLPSNPLSTTLTGDVMIEYKKPLESQTNSQNKVEKTSAKSYYYKDKVNDTKPCSKEDKSKLLEKYERRKERERQRLDKLKELSACFHTHPEKLINFLVEQKDLSSIKIMHFTVADQRKNKIFHMEQEKIGRRTNTGQQPNASKVTSRISLSGFYFKKRNPYQTCDYLLHPSFRNPHFLTYVFRLLKKAIKALDGWGNSISTRSTNIGFKLKSAIANMVMSPRGPEQSYSCDGDAAFDAYCSSVQFLRELGLPSEYDSTSNIQV